MPRSQSIFINCSMCSNVFAHFAYSCCRMIFLIDWIVLYFGGRHELVITRRSDNIIRSVNEAGHIECIWYLQEMATCTGCTHPAATLRCRTKLLPLLCSYLFQHLLISSFYLSHFVSKFVSVDAAPRCRPLRYELVTVMQTYLSCKCLCYVPCDDGFIN